MSFQNIARNVRCWWTTGELCPKAAPAGDLIAESAPPDAWFPDDFVPPATAPTYQGPDIVAKTADPYRTLVQNPVTVGILVLQLALANRSRKEMIVINTGLTTIFIGFGFNPTQTNYTLFLSPCTVANDGTGGSLIDEAWKGPVFALSSNPGGTLNFAEIPE